MGRAERAKKKRKARRKRLKRWTPEALQRLDHDSFLRVFTTAFADRTVLKTGDLVLENRVKTGAPPESVELLLQEAKRRQIPLASLAGHVVDEVKAGESFVSHLLAPESWRRYEIHAAQALITVLKEGGVRLDKIEYDARVRGRISGQTRQIDLLLTQEKPRHVVACEIKEYQGPIPVEKLEAFATKLEDVGANRGAFIAPAGYQRAALAIANRHAIQLFHFQEVPRERFPETKEALSGEGDCWVLEQDMGRRWIFSGTLTEKGR